MKSKAKYIIVQHNVGIINLEALFLKNPNVESFNGSNSAPLTIKNNPMQGLVKYDIDDRSNEEDVLSFCGRGECNRITKTIARILITSK
ncbi:MAG: hypothetical protein NC453_30870 [Muribaculum sp.]|nr:hypothetical protein [Muribaculum sp.]